MIAHLFSKVYLNFDLELKTTFDTLIVSKNPFTVHESFINKHVGIGMSHGRYNTAGEVDWAAFFSSANDRRTVVYADPLNFATIYFSFLKTINPDISATNAKRILEVVLKRAQMYYAEYTSFGSNQSDAAKKDVAKFITTVKSLYDQAWELSTAWPLDTAYIDSNLGIEYLVARYWATNTKAQLVKDKLEAIWWKIFVNWGEEAMKNYSHRWLNWNPGTTPDMFIAQISADPKLSWMADPNLDLEKTDLFKQDHDWSIIERIFDFLQHDQDNGLIIELEPHWETIAARNWDKILDKESPMTLIAMASEPIYRVLLNSWLIVYFANLPTDELKDFVL